MHFSFLKKLFIPHEHNGYHPYLVRLKSLMVYTLIIASANYLFFPLLGLDHSKVAAASSISTSRLVDLVNYSRTQGGLKGVQVDDKLTNAAMAKALNMFTKDYWSHFGPDGESPWQYIKGAGYSYIYAGENLAKDFTDTDTLFSAWMNSPTHRENILKKEYIDMGIAAVSGNLLGKPTILVVQIFGTPIASTNSDNNATAKIFNPLDGAKLTTNSVNINGFIANNDSIQIYDGNKKLGELDSQGGIIDYQADNQTDGDHSYSLKSTGGVSNSVDVNINTSNIVGMTKFFSINQVDGSTRKFEGLFSNDVNKIALSSNGKDSELTKDSVSGLYKLLTSNYVDQSEVSVKVTGANGTKQEFNITLSNKITPIVPINNMDILQTEKTNLSNTSLKERFNLIAAGAILVIFGIDAFFLIKMRKTRTTARTALHILPLFLVILLILTTGIGGTI